ncbi:MAG: proline racemase family protein [Bacteroidota bacterium]
MEMKHWHPPEDWLQIRTIDAHTGGEPFRIIVDGFPALPGDTVLARRRYAREHLDTIRTMLMLEPRGHPDMYGCILTPPDRPDSALGVLFLHNEGYSTMCGHGIIALSKALVDTGQIPRSGPDTEIRIDSPAGQIVATAHSVGGTVKSVSFLNVPSFVVALDQQVDVPGLGQVQYDLAFGGAFYAYVDAASVGVSCRPEKARYLIDKGRAIKKAVMKQRTITHPVDEDLGFLYGVIFVGPAERSAHHSRNVCVFAEGEVDRSPTGTGVSGRLAVHHARGEIGIGESIVIESILGSTFSCQVAEEVTFGPYASIVPRVEGTAHITGQHTFLVDPEDPLRDGFFLR